MSIDNLKNIVAIKIDTKEGEKFLLPTLYTSTAWRDYDGYLSLMWMFILSKNGRPSVSRKEVLEILDFYKENAIKGKTKEEAKYRLKHYTSFENLKLKGKFVSFRSYKNFIIKAMDEALTLKQIDEANEVMFADSIRRYLSENEKLPSYLSKPFEPYISERDLKTLKDTYFPFVRKVSKAPKNWVIEFEKGFFTRRTSRRLFSTLIIGDAKRMTLANAKASLKKIQDSYSNFNWVLREVGN